MNSASEQEKAADTYTLRILHISDLHARGPREDKRRWKRQEVLGDAWLRNLDELAGDGRGFDLVVFTGDVADWGDAKEYPEATEFIKRTLNRLDVPVERLFVVPGNHDVNRKTSEAAWVALREGISTQPQNVGEWFADAGEAPYRFEPAWRDAVLERTRAFWTWVERDLGRIDLVPKKSPHGRLGYSVAVPGLPVPVRVIGLDSAWLAGDDADAGKLWLTEDQLGLLCLDAEGKPWPGFRLALMHHPLSDLADQAQATRRLADTVELLLRGHQHDSIVRTHSDPDRTMRELAAGCLFEGAKGNRHPNGCHVIDAVLNSEGRPLRYDIRFRSWSLRGHWHDDNSLYREANGGRLTWEIVPLLSTTHSGPVASKLPPASPVTTTRTETAFYTRWVDNINAWLTLEDWEGVSDLADTDMLPRSFVDGV